MSAVVAAVAAGEITSGEAAEVGKLVEMFIKAKEAADREAGNEFKLNKAQEDRQDQKDFLQQFKSKLR